MYFNGNVWEVLSGPSNDEIHYTATDQITPDEGSYFGENVNYLDGESTFDETTGKGILKFDSDVTSIGEEAFYNCRGLTSIKIPNSVTSIGNYAFQECSSLTTITIPDSVESIGYSAFFHCTSLTSITCEAIIPPTLGGTNVFDNTNDCPIYVPAQSVDAYKAAENWSEYASRIVGLLNNNQIRYTANEQLTIKDGVDYTSHTFDNGVGIVTFNNDLTTLGVDWFESTFDNYTDNITSLTLPNGVSHIEMSALRNTNTVYYEGTQKECARIDKD